MAELGVMSFNVRQMDGDDGAHAWEHRRDVMIETIRMSQPAVLGTQETWDAQAAYILEHLPQYRAFGRGRYGDDRDKHNKVFYDTRRFELLDTGDIWISRTPNVPGSKAWEIPAPRMITWGVLRLDNTQEIMIMNSHFPYGRDADEARRQTARLVLEWVAGRAKELPIVFTGDFNAKAGGEVYCMLEAAFEDAWVAAGKKLGPEGTVHGFGRFTGGRIDWILCRNMPRVIGFETITHTSSGLYPSDHYPVFARFDTEPAEEIGYYSASEALGAAAGQ